MSRTPSILDIQKTLKRTDIAARQKDKWRDRLSKQQLLVLNLSSKEQKRQEIINEIVLTEKEYLNDLKLVHKMTVDKESGIYVPIEIVRMFSNIADMIRLHDHLYMSLQTRQNMQHPVVQCISEISLKVERFNIYAAYLVNYTSATQQIDKMIQNQTEYGTFLKERERLPDCRKLPLQAFLIAPVQRLAKYPLLFKGLLDVTSQDSPDYDNTCQLYKQMDSLIRQLEDEKRKEDTLDRLTKLELTMKGLTPFKLAIPNRQLIYEGVLKRLIIPTTKQHSSGLSPHFPLISSGNESSISLYVFLFDDLITHVMEIPDDRGYSNLFECTSIHNGRATFILQASNKKEKSQWITMIRSVLKKHTNRNSGDLHDQWWFYYHIKEESRKSMDDNNDSPNPEISF
ncbi:2245_t:CDS:10 [Ambispora gerdemannii]|uniref:2245_t:CDS:1 n=1 Tax=Ambispora gerdemannii TaxID=144530 RepID=A0A9N8Z6S9_9GLOM|nr:2245_t:CDS:10 [Ambispora gerdemannii]